MHLMAISAMRFLVGFGKVLEDWSQVTRHVTSGALGFPSSPYPGGQIPDLSLWQEERAKALAATGLGIPLLFIP